MPASRTGSTLPVKPLRRAVLAVFAVSGAVILHLLAQVSMLVAQPGFSLTYFRNYFASDQLSYMGIVAGAANGQFGAVEPFTETGSMFYPRFYYLVLGAGAQLFDLQPSTAWAIGGLLAQIVLVAAVAIACIAMSGKLWTGLLGAGPFVLGTFSFLTQAGGWYTSMDSHAVLWGPFGVLFTLNAESAGLCAGGVALLLLLLAHQRVRNRAARIVMAVIAAIIIGALANVQTYSFLTTIYLATYVVAAWAVVTAKRRWPLYLSILFIPLLFVLGPIVADRGSPLITLVFGMLPAVPGVIALIIRSRGLVAVYFVLAALAASPSVLSTLLGLSSKDPFLVYRVASSKNLGVDWQDGLIGAIVLIVPLVLVFVAGLVRKNKLWIAYPMGVGTAWVLLATNDIWRANQEPYRFWIDSFMLVSLTLLPILITVFQEFLRRERPVAESDETPDATTSVEPSSDADPAPVLSVPPVTRRQRVIALVALVVLGVLVLTSMLDWARFYRDGLKLPLISYSGPRELAIADAAESVDEGLILTDPCVDPQTLKIVSGKPTVYMNFGMAWPEEYEDVLQLLASRGENTLDLDAARGADVKWVMTDSACSVSWADDYASMLTEETTVAYGGDSITLWRFDPDGQ